MPEGDTIFRSARALRAGLQGKRVEKVSTSVAQVRALGVDRLVGQTVSDVEPRGKHLLHWFAPSGLALHTHMRMSGSWHLYRPGQRWRRSPGAARFVLEVPGVVAVCFAAPVCELLSAGQVERHPVLSALGPDALADDVDLVEARRRLDALPDTTVGEAMLDQRVLAGVGNVYKSEVLHVLGIDPWARVGDLDGPTRDALLATAVRLLRANVGPTAGPRITTGGDRAAGQLFVYGKARRGCPRCATPIRAARQGEQARLTYWCPGCQAPSSVP